MATTYDVELYVYDLSQGFAAMMSEPLLGKFSSTSFSRYQVFRWVVKSSNRKVSMSLCFRGKAKIVRIDFRISVGRNLSHCYCRLWKRILLWWRNFWVWCHRIGTTRYDTARYDIYYDMSHII